MTKRKALSNKTRFEVFKRDSFTCQYCGKKSPEVVLNVDHISPVSRGGKDDILNLITSCFPCNSGKSDRKISDNSVVQRQRAQLDDLNERRNQMEMMVSWRESLTDLQKDYVYQIQNILSEGWHFEASSLAVKEIGNWVKLFSFHKILQAIDTSYLQYVVNDDDGVPTPESWSKAFRMVPRIANVLKNGGMDENLRLIFYARGVLRKRLPNLDDRAAINVMKDAVAHGVQAEIIVSESKRATSWTGFLKEINFLISGVA